MLEGVAGRCTKRSKDEDRTGLQHESSVLSWKPFQRFCPLAPSLANICSFSCVTLHVHPPQRTSGVPVLCFFHSPFSPRVAFERLNPVVLLNHLPPLTHPCRDYTPETTSVSSPAPNS